MLLFHMPQNVVPELSFINNDLVIDHVNEFTILDLILDSNLNWNVHLNNFGYKIAGVHKIMVFICNHFFIIKKIFRYPYSLLRTIT